MAFYTMIGFIVVAAVIGVGAYWVVSNITFKRQPERFTYKKMKMVMNTSVITL